MKRVGLYVAIGYLVVMAAVYFWLAHVNGWEAL